MTLHYYPRPLSSQEAAALAKSPSTIKTYTYPATALKVPDFTTDMFMGERESRLLVARSRSELLGWMERATAPIFHHAYLQRHTFWLYSCIFEYRNLGQMALGTPLKVARAVPQALVHAPIAEFKALARTISSAAHTPAVDRWNRLKAHHSGYLDTMSAFNDNFNYVKTPFWHQCAFMIVTLNDPYPSSCASGGVTLKSLGPWPSKILDAYRNKLTQLLGGHRRR